MEKGGQQDETHGIGWRLTADTQGVAPPQRKLAVRQDGGGEKRVVSGPAFTRVVAMLQYGRDRRVPRAAGRLDLMGGKTLFDGRRRDAAERERRHARTNQGSCNTPCRIEEWHATANTSLPAHHQLISIISCDREKQKSVVRPCAVAYARLCCCTQKAGISPSSPGVVSRPALCLWALLTFFLPCNRGSITLTSRASIPSDSRY